MPYQPCQMEPRCSIGRVISRKEVITLSKGFELKLDEKALRSVASDGIKKMLTTGELEYTCPNCGEQITSLESRPHALADSFLPLG